METRLIQIETVSAEEFKAEIVKAILEQLIPLLQKDKIEENKYLVFKHLGEMANGVEDTESEKVKVWSGSKEAYYLEENDGKTTLKVEVDSDENYKEMFDNGFTKGLQIIKELSEKQ